MNLCLEPGLRSAAGHPRLQERAPGDSPGPGSVPVLHGDRIPGSESAPEGDSVGGGGQPVEGGSIPAVGQAGFRPARTRLSTSFALALAGSCARCATDPVSPHGVLLTPGPSRGNLVSVLAESLATPAPAGIHVVAPAHPVREEGAVPAGVAIDAPASLETGTGALPWVAAEVPATAADGVLAASPSVGGGVAATPADGVRSSPLVARGHGPQGPTDGGAARSASAGEEAPLAPTLRITRYVPEPNHLSGAGAVKGGPSDAGTGLAGASVGQQAASAVATGGDSAPAAAVAGTSAAARGTDGSLAATGSDGTPAAGGASGEQAGVGATGGGPSGRLGAREFSAARGNSGSLPSDGLLRGGTPAPADGLLSAGGQVPADEPLSPGGQVPADEPLSPGGQVPAEEALSPSAGGSSSNDAAFPAGQCRPRRAGTAAAAAHPEVGAEGVTRTAGGPRGRRGPELLPDESASATAGPVQAVHRDGAALGRAEPGGPALTAETAPSPRDGVRRALHQGTPGQLADGRYGYRPAELEVQVDGGELGLLSVRVAERRGTVAARFLVEDGTASHLLQRNLPALEQRLQGAGLTPGHLEVSLGGQGWHGHRPSQEGRRAHADTTGVAAVGGRRAEADGNARLRAPPGGPGSPGTAGRLVANGGYGLDLLM